MAADLSPDVMAEEAAAELSPPEKSKRNKFAYVCAILVSMTLLLLGYDIGVMSGAIIYIKREMRITDTQVEILVGILSIYSLLGSFAAGRISDMIGRRRTIVLAGALFFAGALLMGFAVNYELLMLGRFFAGIGVGFSGMIANVYIVEISPASSRGFLTSFPEVSVNVGILLGYLSNYFFSKLPLHMGWRFMLGIGAIPSFFFAIAALAMPESPRWLVMQGRLGDAKLVLYKTSGSNSEADLRLSDIKQAAGIPANCNDDIVQVEKKKSHGKGVWKELLLRPKLQVRRVLIVAIGIHFFNQACGADAIVLYSPRIFAASGLKFDNQQLLATVAVRSVKATFILVSMFLLDRLGRRPLLLISVGGMFLSLLTLGMSITLVDHNNAEEGHKKTKWAVGLSVAAIMTYMAAYSVGLGPIAWIYSSEIFPSRLRAQGMSVGVMMNRVTSGAISMSFLSLTKAITTGGAFFLFGGIAMVAWVFVYTFLPETKGKTLEEMDELFGNFRWNESKAKERGVVESDTNPMG